MSVTTVPDIAHFLDNIMVRMWLIVVYNHVKHVV